MNAAQLLYALWTSNSVIPSIVPNHLYRLRNVRWGGGTQDNLGTVLIQSNWQAMADLHAVTGCKYMIALNLMVSSVSLAP